MTSTDINKEKLPRHIAVIMDGNGRWAKKRSLPRIRGHQVGMDLLKSVISTCAEIGIEYLSLYAFSTENWFRPEKEVRALIKMLKTFLQKEIITMANRYGIPVITATQMLASMETLVKRE